MKKLLFLFALIISSCSSFKSGLTIPANETFILGESNSKNYSAELVNTSNYEVKIRGEKKQNTTKKIIIHNKLNKTKRKRLK